MPATDPFVKALADLCAREGGYASVADKAKVNADGLWQVLNGVKLPSGNPRGIGPGTRKKLTDAYPDWLDSGKSITNPPPAHADSSQDATEGVASLVMKLGAALGATDPITRAQTGPILEQLHKTPELAAELGARLEATIAMGTSQTPFTPFNPFPKK